MSFLAQRHLFRKFLAAAALCAAASAHAQTWTVTGLNTIGCNSGDTTLNITITGTASGTWYFDATADVGSDRYMDSYIGPIGMDGTGYTPVNSVNVRGQQTQVFPLPPNTPFIVTLILRDAAQTPVYKTVVQISQCNGGVITSNVSGPVSPVVSSSAAAVPALGEWSLLALGLAAAGLGARRLRRRA